MVIIIVKLEIKIALVTHKVARHRNRKLLSKISLAKVLNLSPTQQPTQIHVESIYRKYHL